MPNLLTIHLQTALPLPDGPEPPEWAQLLPVGTFKGRDGRGPYTVHAATVIANTTLPVIVDEMHITHLGAASGAEARARGWVEELQDRGADGVWGRIVWNSVGQQLLRDKAYRGLSPAMKVAPKSTRVLLLDGISLTNRPNLPIKPLLQSQEQPMDIMEYLRQLLGLEPDADDTTVRSTLQAVVGDRTMQSEGLGRIAEALGAARDAKPATILTALQSRLTAAGRAGELEQTVIALQSQVAEMQTAGRRVAAEAAVDAAIRSGRAAINAQRDRYITLHMQDAEAAQAIMDSIPSLHSGGLPTQQQPGNADLSAEDSAVIALMGVDAEAFKAQRTIGTGPVEVVTGTESA
jgi:phage I-like protein